MRLVFLRSAVVSVIQLSFACGDAEEYHIQNEISPLGRAIMGFDRHFGPYAYDAKIFRPRVRLGVFPGL